MGSCEVFKMRIDEMKQKYFFFESYGYGLIKVFKYDKPVGIRRVT